MKATFTVQWPDDYGPDWMNVNNLMICLQNTCPDTTLTVSDKNYELHKGPLFDPSEEAKRLAAQIWFDKSMEKYLVDKEICLKIARLIDKARAY